MKLNRNVINVEDRQADRVELTSLFIAIASGEDGGVTRQQFDRQRFDPSHQRHRHPWAFDRHHPRHRRHSATVLKQPEETEEEAERRNGRVKREQETVCWGGKNKWHRVRCGDVCN